MSKPLPLMTKGELGWFAYSMYSEPKVAALSLSDWVELLGERLMLRSWIEQGRNKEVLAWFENIKREPLRIRRTRRDNWQANHPTDAPTISLLHHADLSELHGTSRLYCPDNIFEPIALAGGRVQMAWDGSMNVQVNVDLSAPRTQIAKDFKQWLGNMLKTVPKAKQRNYWTAIEEWSAGSYVPFYDLRLFADASEKRISQQQTVELLELHPTKDRTDQLRVPRRALRAFTMRTLHAMKLQVAREALSVSKTTKECSS